jgi:hypothetical protein
MRLWIKKNLRNLIVGCFIIPILLVAFVSISHVTTMYELSNPMVWSVYLSVAIEIAALSALAAVSVKMGRFIYIPFIIVTIIQFLGNLFFAYSFIDETSLAFKNWVELIGPLFEPMGIETSNIASQKRILAFFTGGLLPFISLTFAHMLVVFTEKNKIDDTEINQNSPTHEPKVDDIEELSRQASKWEQENDPEPKPMVLSEDELNKLEESLNTLVENETIPEVITEEESDNKEIKTLKYVNSRK